MKKKERLQLIRERATKLHGLNTEESEWEPEIKQEILRLVSQEEESGSIGQKPMGGKI